MITKTALVAALVFGTASVALATEFDPNLGNRYPGFASQSAPALESRNVALSGGQTVISGGTQFDRASSPYAGGGY